MSVSCPKCRLFNSFSFSTKQTKCIKCNTNLDKNDVTASLCYQTSLQNREFKSVNNSWEKTKDTHVIGRSKDV